MSYNPAYNRFRCHFSFLSQGDLTGQRYALVKIGSSGQSYIQIIGSASDKPIGVCPDEPFTGQDATVRMAGIWDKSSQVIAAGAIAVGDDLFSDGTGKVMSLTALLALATPGTYWFVGRALTPATASGQLVEAELIAPVQTSVLAAPSSAQIATSPTEAEYNALQADFAALVAVLAANPGAVRIIYL